MRKRGQSKERREKSKTSTREEDGERERERERERKAKQVTRQSMVQSLLCCNNSWVLFCSILFYLFSFFLSSLLAFVTHLTGWFAFPYACVWMWMWMCVWVCMFPCFSLSRFTLWSLVFGVVWSAAPLSLPLHFHPLNPSIVQMLSRLVTDSASLKYGFLFLFLSLSLSLSLSWWCYLSVLLLQHLLSVHLVFRL